MRTRFLTTLAALLAFAAAAPAADKQQPKIIWHGQSFFEIISGEGTRIVIDPHAIEAYGRAVVSADLILMSHTHNDHTQVDVVTDYKKVKQINAIKDPKGDGVRTDWNKVDETFKDVKIRTVAAYHDNMEGMQRGKDGIWVIEMDGLHIVHLGDLGCLLSPEQVKQIGPVDVLMVPAGGIYTINGTDARKVVKQLKPTRYVLPMHYGTKVYDDLLPLDEFLDEVKPTLIKKFESNELTIDPTTDPPKEPLIAILNWEKK